MPIYPNTSLATYGGTGGNYKMVSSGGNYIVSNISYDITSGGSFNTNIQLLSSSSNSSTSVTGLGRFLDTQDYDAETIKLRPGKRTLELPDGSFLKLHATDNSELELQDGTVIHLDGKGNYRIDDANARVIYKGNQVREFNRFVNASDIFEEFIHYVGKLGVTREQLPKLPVELFIKYIIIRATEEDGDLVPEEMKLEHHPALMAPRKHTSRCLSCGRFVRKVNVQKGIPFCTQVHMLAYTSKQEIFAA